MMSYSCMVYGVFRVIIVVDLQCMRRFVVGVVVVAVDCDDMMVWMMLLETLVVEL